MITFCIAILSLLAGFFIYGRYMDRIMGVKASRKTPAYRLEDGVDYVPMSTWRVFLVQFLNIAGLGPIFGAIAGAAWGPVAYLWIVLGCVFGGAVHDYFSGMLSLRQDGLSVPEIVGKYLGNGFRQFMRGFTLILMVMVGVVFIIGPARLLAGLTPEVLDFRFWVLAVFCYYILATLLPIDKIIGRIYPFFGFVLLFMAVAIISGLFWYHYSIPELTAGNFRNMHSHPDHFPVFPLLFVTIACGAVSGFHSTQAPMMARCIKNERLGRHVFYGAMIAEGILACIWAAAAMSFYGGVQELNGVMTEHKGNAAWVVNEISNTLLGKLGAVLAILGVVAAPITSGDTAFRSARLIAADFLRIPQKKILNRLLISTPLFVIGFLGTSFDFSIVWRYMAWWNQTLAAIVLWTITIFLMSAGKNYWVAIIPAVFMTAVSSSYLLVAPEGLNLQENVSILTGLLFTLLFSVLFIVRMRFRTVYIDL
ncbi:MAG TPA: carbon starvation protein A [Bacteroidales bacterium]|nr:carbon starvation protein A [Bacteroidales bacterium]HSA44760.1 carbon starvation protein A [Bacteroidales bacterium]